MPFLLYRAVRDLLQDVTRVEVRALQDQYDNVHTPSDAAAVVRDGYQPATWDFGAVPSVEVRVPKVRDHSREPG